MTTPTMLFVGGRRVFCWCGASVFGRDGSVYTCNGCGTEYEEGS